MTVTQRLDLRQHQSLVMTPQLQQAIKLLQFSNMELAAFVREELERNPLLEPDEGENVEASSDPKASTLPGPGAEPGPEPDGNEAGGSEEIQDPLDSASPEVLREGSDRVLDSDSEELYGAAAAVGWLSDPGGLSHLTDRSGGRDHEAGQSLGHRLSEDVSLRQHLFNQVQMDLSDPGFRIIAVHLIEMLDESGYLVAEFDDLVAILNCAAGDIEATLKAVQGFDPPGIFARSLRECLALQLADRNRLDPAMAALLDNLDLVAKREFVALRKICGVGKEDLAEMIAEIKALDPKPAQAFETEVAETIIPDIFMRAVPGGGWAVELNSDTLPRVLVNARYYALVAGRARSAAEREYISEQLQSANWLVKSLHQRATTILKVASEIVRQQDGFFRKGIQHLKPLTLRNIAEEVHMHESTISRVTSNKYMDTPRGVYELKYFFTASIGGTDGAAHSAEAVRHRIKALIEAETAGSILSDDRIVELLRGAGIAIARRTVAKYREGMGIASSVQRRREKAL